MAKVTSFIGLVTTSHDFPSHAARDRHERPKTGQVPTHAEVRNPQTLNPQNPKLQALNRLEGFEFRKLGPLPIALNTKPSETHIFGFAENGSTVALVVAVLSAKSRALRLWDLSPISPK